MSKDESKNTPVTASFGYTIGNLCLKGVGFITVPIFARLLSTSDFGVYNTFIACEGIIYIFISFALNASMKNAKYAFPDSLDEYTSSIAVLPAITALLTLFLSYVARQWVAKVLSLSPDTISLLVIYSYCSGLVILYQSRIALDYNYKEYLKLAFFNLVCNVSVSIILILTVFSDMRYMGRILGGTISYSIIAAYILHRIFRISRPHFNSKFWKYGLKISLPLIPHALAQTLLLSSDRIMITKMIGNAETGLYSFSYTLYSIIQIVINSLDTVFSPWVFKKLHENNSISDVKKMGTCFAQFIALVVMNTFLICPELIGMLGGKKYSESVYSAFPVLLSGFFALSYCVPAVLEYYSEKTKFISMGTTIAAFLNIALNYFFIKKIGYIGAAYSTLISYIIYFFLHMYISYRISGFSIINFKFLIITLAILVLTYCIGLQFLSNPIIRLGTLIGANVIQLYLIALNYGINNLANLFNYIKQKR